MEPLNLKETKLICARPTCGMYTLIVSDSENRFLNTDWLTFNFLAHTLSPAQNDLFLQFQNKGGTSQNHLKLLLERMHRWWLYNTKPSNGEIICTSLAIEPSKIPSAGKSVYVTRNPHDAYRLLLERKRLKKGGEDCEPSLTLDEVTRWMAIPSWVEEQFDYVITLDENEFLCDVFGVEPMIDGTGDQEQAAQTDLLWQQEFVQPENLSLTLWKKGGSDE